MLTSFGEVADKYKLIPADAGLEHVEAELQKYDELDNLSAANTFFRDPVTREGLVQYIYFTSTDPRGPVGIEFAEVFQAGLPLWLVANYNATVRPSYGSFLPSIDSLVMSAILFSLRPTASHGRQRRPEVHSTVLHPYCTWAFRKVRVAIGRFYIRLLFPTLFEQHNQRWEVSLIHLFSRR